MQKRDYNQGRIHRATEFQLIIHKKRLPYGDPESPKNLKTEMNLCDRYQRREFLYWEEA